MPSFTKLHYEKVARVLKEERIYLDMDTDNRYAVAELNRVGVLLADMFKADNPSFKIEVFHAACQP